MSRDLSHVKAVGCFCPWPPWDASSVSSQSEPPWPRAAALELEAELWTQVSMNLKTLRDARHTHSLRDGEAAQIPWPGGGVPLPASGLLFVPCSPLWVTLLHPRLWLSPSWAALAPG